jgi:prophage regulatory protein
MDANQSGIRFIAWPELEPRVPYTRQHLSRLERAGKFPKRVRVGNNQSGRVAWVASEVDAWFAARVAERDQPEAA